MKKIKLLLVDDLEEMSMAVAFAEAGEFDTARQMMEEEEDEGRNNRKNEWEDDLHGTGTR